MQEFYKFLINQIHSFFEIFWLRNWEESFPEGWCSEIFAFF